MSEFDFHARQAAYEVRRQKRIYRALATGDRPRMPQTPRTRQSRPTLRHVVEALSEYAH